MTISNIKRRLFVALILIHQIIIAQQTPVIEVRGRVVEIVNGKAVGVPKVTVAISNTDYDITAADGSFTLYSKSSNQKFVKLTLTNGLDNREMLAPIEGVVNIPPSKNIEVMLCSQQNQALKTQVAALNTKVKSLQSKYNLSARQVQNLQKEMLDTVLFYEARIQEIHLANAQLNAQQNAASKAENEKKDQIIKQLETDLRQTMQQLMAAKDAQFLEKQTQFQSISATLRQYSDALHNLRDMLLPDRVATYFMNEAAITALNKRIDAYNLALENLSAKQDAHLTAVQHYWTDPSVKTQLASTYAYILTDVHDKTVYPVEFSVNDIIKKYATGKLGRQQAQKKAVEATKEPFSRVTALLPTLEEKITNTINSLKQDF
jgi:hypothetical protein